MIGFVVYTVCVIALAIIGYRWGLDLFDLIARALEGGKK